MTQPECTHELLKNLRSPNPTIRAIAQAVFDDLWTRYTQALKAAGYQKVYIGAVETQHWPGLNHSGAVFAEPPQRPDPPLWDINRRFFGQSCGNGMKHADNGFVRHGFPTYVYGEHVL